MDIARLFLIRSYVILFFILQFPYTHHLEGGVLLVRKPQMESEKAESMEKTEKAESDADDEAAAKRRKLD